MILGNLLSLLEQEWPHKILSNVNHSVILRWHWIKYYSWAHFLREEATPLESESRTLSPSVPSITCPISEIFFMVQCGKFEESESIHSEFNITSFHRTAKSKTAGKIASSSWCPFILICKKKKSSLVPWDRGITSMFDSQCVQKDLKYRLWQMSLLFFCNSFCKPEEAEQDRLTFSRNLSMLVCHLT